jgi:hypothetical protein
LDPGTGGHIHMIGAGIGAEERCGFALMQDMQGVVRIMQ